MRVRKSPIRDRSFLERSYDYAIQLGTMFSFYK